MAANCCARPTMIWLLVGVTTSEVRFGAGGVTVSTAVPLRLPLCAVTVTAVAVATLAAVARPPALMVSADGLLDDQVALAVRSLCD